jgi:Fe2+ transport system protein B
MVEKGSCPTKDTCPFHVPITPKPMKSSSGQRRVCYKEVLETGSCEKGAERCRFSHDIPTQVRQDMGYVQQVRATMQTNSICINEYHKVNSCRKKNHCSHRHTIQTHERENPEIQRKMAEKWEKITKPKVESNAQNRGSIKEAIDLMQKLQAMLNGCARRQEP